MTAATGFQVERDRVRRRLLKYTRRAYRMLPQMDRPRILDIGCGSGIPTMELARLSGGEVTGIDLDQDALDLLDGRIRKAGLAAMVRTTRGSILEADFPPESFDIVWAEGSIHAAGFRRGLEEWRRLLKPGGFIVVHDEQGDVAEKLLQLSACGYALLGHFGLDEDVWRTEYFTPLEKLIVGTERHPNSPSVLAELERARSEVSAFRKDPSGNRSVFFVARRKDARD